MQIWNMQRFLQSKQKNHSLKIIYQMSLKLQSFCSSEDTVKKRQATDCEKVSEIHVCAKGLLTTVCK